MTTPQHPPLVPTPRVPTAPGRQVATTSGDRSGATVLVTGAGGPAGIAVIRRLMALGHAVVAADADQNAAGSRLASRGVLLPRADHPRFADALLGVAAAYGVTALIGTVAEELPALVSAAPVLEASGVATWLPDPEAVRLCCDKAAFAEIMRESGVPHPPTAARAGEVTTVPGPWVVKPRSGRGSRGVSFPQTAREAADALAADPELIAQTRLPGREFTADALVDRDGRLLTVVPRWRDETKAGISVKGTTFESEAVTAVAAAALAAVRLTGPANVQGFVADDGTATVVEINPRFSGGLPLTLAAGADLVATYLAGVRDPGAELPLLWFTPGIRMSRYFAETYTGPDGLPVADPCAAPVAVPAVYA
jgi:carbamoyl-phosphate synthase large subunit